MADKAYKVLRLDVMSGNRDNSQVKSARFYDDGDSPAAIENATFVEIGGLDNGEREVHKVTPITSSSTYVGIVSTPELIYEQCGIGDRDLSNFINEAGDIIRVHVLHAGDSFSIANFETTSDIPVGANFTAKYIGSEVVGRYTYRCFEIQPKNA